MFVMTRQRKQFGGPMRSQIWDLWIPCLNPLPLSHRYSSVSWAPTGFISLCDTRPTYCQDKLCQKRDISVRIKRDIFQLGHKKEKDALCILACLECWHCFVRRNEDDHVPWVWQCVCHYTSTKPWNEHTHLLSLSLRLLLLLLRLTVFHFLGCTWGAAHYSQTLILCIFALKRLKVIFLWSLGETSI